VNVKFLLTIYLLFNYFSIFIFCRFSDRKRKAFAQRVIQ